MDKQRIDKWLWSVRLYKTRSQAARACRGGKVKLGGEAAKPAKEIQEDECVNFTKKGVKYTVKVLAIPGSRVGAPAARKCYEDLTPEEELEKLKRPMPSAFYAQYTGKGRPTKKERRTLDEYLKKKRRK